MSRWFAGLLCSTHMQAHTHTHANTHTHTHARSCHLSFILHLSFPLHISRQDNATLWIVRDLCVCARVCVWKSRAAAEWSRKNLLSQDKPLRWSSEKLMTHSHIHLCESLLFTCQPLCIQEELLVTEVLFQSCITAYLPLSRKWHTAHLDEVAWAKSGQVQRCFGTTNGLRTMRNISARLLKT